MRRTWLNSVAAILYGVALMAAPVAAGPFGMAQSSSPASTTALAPSTTSASSWWSPTSWKFWGNAAEPEVPLYQRQSGAAPVAPSKQISPWRHPIRYFAAAMSETPAAQAMSKKSQPPTPTDSIALSEPVGPATPETIVAFAQLSERQGNVEQSRAQFRKALAQWPNNVEVLRATARLEDRQGQLAVAEGLYRRAVTADPQNAGAYNDLGLCLARQGKLEESVQVIEQAICLQPDKALYRNNAATVLVELHQDQRALAHLSTVHGAAASNFNLGQLLVARGRTPEAVPYFQAAVELDPTLEAAREALAKAGAMPMSPSQMAGDVTPVTPVTLPPTYGPHLAPQRAAPQPGFPETAQGPAWNASSAVAPSVPYPSQSVPYVAPTNAAPNYQTATIPRYLPVPGRPSETTVR